MPETRQVCLPGSMTFGGHVFERSKNLRSGSGGILCLRAFATQRIYVVSRSAQNCCTCLVFSQNWDVLSILRIFGQARHQWSLSIITYGPSTLILTLGSSGAK